MTWTFILLFILINSILCQLSLIMILLLPLSVHELQPADIKVIGALGDSLTVSTAVLPGLK